jgi:hypothetical protein
MDRSPEGLARLFTALGARDPEAWARSQAEEGISQLHRFLFLRQAWACIASESDDSWIDRQIEYARRAPDAPFSGAGRAMAALLERGADRADVVDLIRGAQAELLVNLCRLLEDPGLDGEARPEVRSIGWRLVETDERDEPTDRAIALLHESVLSTDPTGREMRPRRT